MSDQNTADLKNFAKYRWRWASSAAVLSVACAASFVLAASTSGGVSTNSIGVGGILGGLSMGAAFGAAIGFVYHLANPNEVAAFAARRPERRSKHDKRDKNGRYSK